MYQNNCEKEEKELVSCLSRTISEATGRNTRIQLLSGVCKKGYKEKYFYNQIELVHKFQGITLYDIKLLCKISHRDIN